MYARAVDYSVVGMISRKYIGSFPSYAWQEYELYSMCDGRRPAVINGDWMAVVPQEVRKGDWVASLKGAKDVPFVIRDTGNSSPSSSEDGKPSEVRLVGECYVLELEAAAEILEKERGKPCETITVV